MINLEFLDLSEDSAIINHLGFNNKGSAICRKTIKKIKFKSFIKRNCWN